MPARSARHAALVVCAVALWPSMRPAVAGDPEIERGRQVFLACQACHQVGSKARHRVGPTLNNIFGRRAGTLEGFNYSGGMRDAGQNGLVWNEAELSNFIEAPARHVPGTTMMYRGLPDEDDRTALVAFIRQHSPGPANLPETPPTEPLQAPAGDPDVPEHIVSIAGDPAYGEYLSGECVTCHQASGEDKGIPSITGWPARQFATVMHAYKSKHRENPVMRSVAASLTDEEIAALAAYFASIE
ncbi:c-type cytochrome [Stappia sp.]|uniref:c-type cytochrome n=1 Tax=Stappia sp. TaxID=1870903 RepID=UPI003A9977D8